MKANFNEARTPLDLGIKVKFETDGLSISEELDKTYLNDLGLQQLQDLKEKLFNSARRIKMNEMLSDVAEYLGTKQIDNDHDIYTYTNNVTGLTVSVSFMKNISTDIGKVIVTKDGEKIVFNTVEKLFVPGPWVNDINNDIKEAIVVKEGKNSDDIFALKRNLISQLTISDSGSDGDKSI